MLGTVEAFADPAGRIVKKLKALNAEIEEIRNRIQKVLDWHALRCYSDLASVTKRSGPS